MEAKDNARYELAKSYSSTIKTLVALSFTHRHWSIFFDKLFAILYYVAAYLARVSAYVNICAVESGNVSEKKWIFADVDAKKTDISKRLKNHAATREVTMYDQAWYPNGGQRTAQVLTAGTNTMDALSDPTAASRLYIGDTMCGAISTLVAARNNNDIRTDIQNGLDALFDFLFAFEAILQYIAAFAGLTNRGGGISVEHLRGLIDISDETLLTGTALIGAGANDA